MTKVAVVGNLDNLQTQVVSPGQDELTDSGAMHHLARDILTPETTIKKCHKTMVDPSVFVLPV